MWFGHDLCFMFGGNTSFGVTKQIEKSSSRYESVVAASTSQKKKLWTWGDANQSRATIVVQRVNSFRSVCSERSETHVWAIVNSCVNISYLGRPDFGRRRVAS